MPVAGCVRGARETRDQCGARGEDGGKRCPPNRSDPFVFLLRLFFGHFFYWLPKTKRQQRKGSLGDWREGFAVGWKKTAENKEKNGRCNQQQLNEISTQTQQSRLLKESARLKRLLGQSSNLDFFWLFWWTIR
jgi:hypothetical protein